MPIQTVLACLSMTPSRRPSRHPRRRRATRCDGSSRLVYPRTCSPRASRSCARPRTASGKTARAAMARRGVPPPPARRVQSAFPRRERVLGALVHAAWSRELGVPPHAITRASRFAELGGDSMVAARVSAAACTRRRARPAPARGGGGRARRVWRADGRARARVFGRERQSRDVRVARRGGPPGGSRADRRDGFRDGFRRDSRRRERGRLRLV